MSKRTTLVTVKLPPYVKHTSVKNLLFSQSLKRVNPTINLRVNKTNVLATLLSYITFILAHSHYV